MKVRVNYTIEKELIDRLNRYIEKRKEILQTKVSRSSIVEEALARHLIKIENELEESPKGKGLSIVQ